MQNVYTDMRRCFSERKERKFFILLLIGNYKVWAVGRSFGPVREGLRRSRPVRVSQLWVKKLVSTRHHWANVFVVRRQGQRDRLGQGWAPSGSVTHHMTKTSNHTTGCEIICGAPTTLAVKGLMMMIMMIIMKMIMMTLENLSSTAWTTCG